LTQNSTEPKVTRTIFVIDPRTLDGNPYEVAQNAVLQAAGTAEILIEAVRDARVMARNAAMERGLVLNDEPDAPGWEAGPEAKRYDAILDQLGGNVKTLKQLARAAAFDPKAPLGKA
jgi:hypothetical protein